MLDYLRKKIPDRNPLRLAWHKVCGMWSALSRGLPGRKLDIIFVTGTKGKTTTAWTLGTILQLSGVQTAVATTALFRCRDEVWANETKMTTLGRAALQDFLKRAHRSGCQVAVVEASSQAMTQSRLWGMRARGTVWTNLQEDHLEYHGGWEKYRQAKGNIIAKVHADGFTVLNADDPEYGWFARRAEQDNVRVWSVGQGSQDWQIKQIQIDAQGMQFELGAEKLAAQFTGNFNVFNLAEAALAAHAYGLGWDDIRAALQQARPVPGRLEEVINQRGLQIYIDFAYTPQALTEALAAVREKMNPKGKLWVMFGAVAGGRDVSKRPKMSAAAEQAADKIILTDDDLGPEDDSEQVLAGVVQGFSTKMQGQKNQKWWQITPREKAVEFVLRTAQVGDAILFAGKGCEQLQHFGARQRKYSELEVIEQNLVKL